MLDIRVDLYESPVVSPILHPVFMLVELVLFIPIILIGLPGGIGDLIIRVE